MLHADWEKVKQGLQYVLDKTHDLWLAEDIYAGLKQNRMTLHLAYEDGDYAGFLILQPLQGWDGPELFVVVAVDKAVAVPCVQNPPPSPRFASDSELKAMADYELVITLLVERIQREIYESELDAALEACK